MFCFFCFCSRLQRFSIILLRQAQQKKSHLSTPKKHHLCLKKPQSQKHVKMLLYQIIRSCLVTNSSFHLLNGILAIPTSLILGWWRKEFCMFYMPVHHRWVDIRNTYLLILILLCLTNYINSRCFAASWQAVLLIFGWHYLLYKLCCQVSYFVAFEHFIALLLMKKSVDNLNCSFREPCIKSTFILEKRFL